VVVAEHPAESLATPDCSASWPPGRLDEPVAEPLMVPFAMVVLDVLVHGSLERARPEEDHPFETLFLDGADEAFGVRVAVRRPAMGPHDPDARAREGVPEPLREVPVVIADQQPGSREAAEDRIGQATGNSDHESVVRIRGDFGEQDATRLQVHEEEHVVRHQAEGRPDLEVHVALSVCDRGASDSPELHHLGQGARRRSHPGEDLPERQRPIEDPRLHGGRPRDLAEAQGGVRADEVVVDAQDLQSVVEAPGVPHGAGSAALEVGAAAAQEEVQPLDVGGVGLARVFRA
jgi:hypothetical protein